MKQDRQLLFVEYLGYITIGIVANMMGPSLIAIRSSFHLNYSQSGLVLSMQFFGMLISVILGGVIADRYGKKPYILAGGLFLTAGLVGVMISGNFLTLILSIIIIGIGYGAYSVGINALGADYAGPNPGKALNLLHLFFGVGAIVSPLIVSFTQSIWQSWRPVF
ncbi:MAG TPA: MFS transporter, partial [Bacillota bacterium]|nr:MFS transporter [Bacillota bacterium]